MITSSLYPHLAESMRWPFRHGVFLVFGALLTFSMLTWLTPLLIVVCLGMPLLFALYGWQSGVFRDVSPRVLLPAIAVSAAISVTWWVWSEALVARVYDIPVAVGSQLLHGLALGLTVSLAGTGLMLAPTVVVKFFHRRVSESLDGFVIGASCALTYSAAGTIAWLAPQVAVGLVDNYAPWRLFEEAFFYGFVDPIVTTAAGGLLGLRLWFRPGSRCGDPRRVRRILEALTAAGIVIYLAIYLVDAADLSRFTEIAVNAVLAAMSLVTLRAAIQVTLLHEEADPGTGATVVCEDCSRTVTDRPFCPGCGAASRAMSRTTRSRRFEVPSSGDGD